MTRAISCLLRDLESAILDMTCYYVAIVNKRVPPSGWTILFLIRGGGGGGRCFANPPKNIEHMLLVKKKYLAEFLRRKKHIGQV